MRKKLTDDYVGKYAKLKYGFAGGLIGKIEKNTTRMGVSPYVHITKSGMRTGVTFQDDIELVDIEGGGVDERAKV